MIPLQSFAYSIPYLLVFLLLFVLAIPVSNKNIALVNRVPQAQFFFLVLFFFIGLRGYIYTDWKIYLPFWESCPTLWNGYSAILNYLDTGAFSSWEKGFVVYGIALKSFSSRWEFFQSVTFSIDFFALYLIFRRYMKNRILLGFFIWYIFGGVIGLGLSINFLRNSKALILFLFSIRYLEKRCFWKYAVINGFASLFHVSSILFIPLYYILIRKWWDTLILLFFFLGNIIYLFQVKWCMPVIEVCAEVLGGRLGSIAQSYLLSEKWTTGYGFSIGFFERTATFVLLFRFRRKLMDKPVAVVFYNLFYLYIFSYLYLSEMSILTDRIPFLFISSYWFLLPRLYNALKKDGRIIFLLFFLLYSMLKILSANRSILVMYDNLLFQNFSFSERIFYNRLYLGQ